MSSPSYTVPIEAVLVRPSSTGKSPVLCAGRVQQLMLDLMLRDIFRCRESDQAEVRASGLVERLAAMAERRLSALTPQQLADTLDALARLEFRAPAKFLKVQRLPQESIL